MNILNIFSISITGIVVVVLVLFLVYFLSNLLILLSNRINIKTKNEENIEEIISSKIKDISEGKGKIVKITKID